MSFRIEQKLHIAPDKLPQLLEWVSQNGGSTLFPERTITSIYFDTDDLKLYQDSNEGALPRKKIRIRCYGNCDHTSGTHTLETKISAVEGRYKESEKLVDVERHLEFGFFDPTYGSLRPLLSVQYEREYFAIHGIRLTIDRNIRYAKFGTTEYRSADSRIAVELKANDATSMDYLMNKFPFPRIRFSKYAFAVEALSLHTSMI